MDTRWARRLTALYPTVWRARYGDEFVAFLEDETSTVGAIANVVMCAIRERLCGAEVDIDRRHQSLIYMTYAYLAAVAAVGCWRLSRLDTP